jgi:hypothetical protein
MKVVEFECGCVGLRDFDTEETIIFRDCEFSPDDVKFYPCQNAHDEKPSRDLPASEEKAWFERLRLLIADGHSMRQIRKLMIGRLV